MMENLSPRGRLGRVPAYLLLALLLSGCAGRAATVTAPSVLDRAGAEATAIIEKAHATALVLQARAVATALVEQAARPVITTASLAATSVPPTRPPAVQSTPAAADRLAAASPATDSVQVTRVGFAMEGAMIDVQFKAPYDVSETWWQGSAYIEDEVTGLVYREVPVMPKLGPLMSKPRSAGQVGYIMLVNGPTPLKPGAVVTVVLGDYRFEHVRVE